MSTLTESISGSLDGWTGLDPDLDEAGLRATIDARWELETSPQARGPRAFRVIRGHRSVAPETIEAWIAAGQSRVSSLEYRPPNSIDHGALLADLGEPGLVLGSNHFEVGASVQDHVHASRGITLSVADPFPDEEGNAGDPRVVYVQLYPATTTEEYLTTVGQSGETIRPYPRSPE
jgi:hypothetical protein